MWPCQLRSLFLIRVGIVIGVKKRERTEGKRRFLFTVRPPLLLEDDSLYLQSLPPVLWQPRQPVASLSPSAVPWHPSPAPWQPPQPIASVSPYAVPSYSSPAPWQPPQRTASLSPYAVPSYLIFFFSLSFRPPSTLCCSPFLPLTPFRNPLVKRAIPTMTLFWQCRKPHSTVADGRIDGTTDRLTA